MNPQTLSYYQKHWGQTHKRVASVEAITQISKSFAIARTGQKRQLPMLNLWTERTCFELSQIGRYGGYFQLSWPEVDWLGSELSDWLNLPVRMLSQQQAKRESQQPQEKSPRKPYQPNLPEVSRPGWALCTLKKDNDVLEIFAPRGFHHKGNRKDWFTSALTSPNAEASNTILRIEQDLVSLWDTASLKQCISQANREDITRIRIVYKPGQANKYHVQLEASHVISAKFSDHILLGDRTFWLSQQEAHWLAYELSHRLKRPVSELAIMRK